MRTWMLGVVATLVGAVFVVALRLPVGERAVLLISDLGQLAVAVLASLGCAQAARHSAGHRRQAWALLSVGTACWAAGEIVWSYYEIVLGREVPFPSLADLGFLLFPLVSAVGLVIWLGTQGTQLLARGRDLFDGALIAGSLLLLSWVTTLGTVVTEGADSRAALVLGLAYPVGDVVLGTLVLMALARGVSSERGTLVLLVLGLGGLAFADSAYVYLTSTGAYSSANVVSTGWLIGFPLVGAAGLSVRRTSTAQRHPIPGATAPETSSSLVGIWLPYVPLTAAGVALTAHLAGSPDRPVVELALGLSLIAIVMLRQFLAMVDNQRLLGDLAVARDQLHHQTLHDDLTGLANRVLFADRLDRALMAPDAQVTVMFCDLDDFKQINDQHGHAVGDAFLVEVADRLRSSVRLTDTVARLSGDEFAILIEGGEDATEVAERVVASVRSCREVLGRAVRGSVSVGVAQCRAEAEAGGRTPGSPPGRTDVPRSTLDDRRAALATSLLRSADAAMYAAKAAGKSRVVPAELLADLGPVA